MPLSPPDKTAALAVAATTAVLRHLLENGLSTYGAASLLGGDVLVSALPPSRVPVGAEERAQLNLFLYQVTPHAALRPVPQPARPWHDDTDALPLRLDMAYLLTAFGAQDLHMETLLGCGIQLFHGVPTLGADRLQATLAAAAHEDGGRDVLPVVAALARLARHCPVAEMKIAPLFLDLEEMSRLWSALQSPYRPSIAYKVSVALTPESGLPTL